MLGLSFSYINVWMVGLGEAFSFSPLINSTALQSFDLSSCYLYKKRPVDGAVLFS